MQHAEMRNTVFGEVLAEMLEARSIPVTPFTVGKLAEDAGMDGWKVIKGRKPSLLPLFTGVRGRVILGSPHGPGPIPMGVSDSRLPP